MGFVKVIKSKSYFKRYQVKYRRRREGKTDYRARKRLINQDKNKYNSPKYRLVVRFTNKDIVTQIIYPKIVGDVTLASAYSHELPRYGLSVGLTNYAAAYATGLLLARRLLHKIGLQKYEGKVVADGEDFNVEEKEGARPFLALLDIGLARTTTGAKIFSALKGATDGGLNVPHSETRFAGYSAEEKKLDAAVLRKYIYGGHIAEYMKSLEAENPEKYKKHFSKFVKAGVNGDSLEDLYKKVHAAIRADPSPKKTEKKDYKKEFSKYTRPARLTHEQRKANINKKIQEQINNAPEEEEKIQAEDDE